jgi:predicted XRE-type DNA-binding protein
MQKKTTKRGRPDPDAKVTVSTGNIFADMGRPDADELLAKAALVREINALIEQRGLTQTEAAELLGMHQPDISLLQRGRLSVFSMERLFRCLAILNVTVEVRLRRNPPSTSAPPIRVLRTKVAGA